MLIHLRGRDDDVVVAGCESPQGKRDAVGAGRVSLGILCETPWIRSSASLGSGIDEGTGKMKRTAGIDRLGAQAQDHVADEVPFLDGRRGALESPASGDRAALLEGTAGPAGAAAAADAAHLLDAAMVQPVGTGDGRRPVQKRIDAPLCRRRLERRPGVGRDDDPALLSPADRACVCRGASRAHRLAATIQPRTVARGAWPPAARWLHHGRLVGAATSSWPGKARWLRRDFDLS